MPDSSRDLLDAAYSRLGFVDGDLLSAQAEPGDVTAAEWVNKGDWLSLAKKVGAERIFFVNDYPVVVFAEQVSSDPAEWMRYFNAVWCMARPQVLFLAREGELSVFNLTKQPARSGEAPTEHNRLLDLVRATADVQNTLNVYRREQVESGRLFEDERFGFDDRADRALVRDLGRVRKALIVAGLDPGYAHALIGRSIFIRYLEDRRVLIQEYFRAVARKNKGPWSKLLDDAVEENIDVGVGQPILYPSVLSNKAFTYALFTKLAKDFNGDMFPVDHAEEKAVTDQHLRILQKFLLGGKNDKLFFFAYRFDIIPIELISSIYEKFYSLNPNKRRDEGSYYTPSALVDFVLSETLTDDILARHPRVIDPACGSGIFLVEAFRRIVRYRVGQARRALTSDELRQILRDQIAGMDISSEAIRVAAFSLYLAMLHYLDPPDIRKHTRLPCLTYATRQRTTPQYHYDILVACDAFRIDESVSREAVRNRFLSKCADVVVGNPPWGTPFKTDDPELSSDGGIGWCAKRELSVGDKERSQTFIHRTLDLLREGGRAGLLVSTGVFFKRNPTTKLFREQWLNKVTLKKVVNFAAVRGAFFCNAGDEGEARKQGAIAPFASVIFDYEKPAKEDRFAYWSAKETAFVKRVQAVVLNRADLRLAIQAEYVRDETLWKIYWWGGHRDEALITRLRLEQSFQQILDPEGTRMRVGFQEASRKDPAGWLKKFREFPTNSFERYGVLPEDDFIAPPTRVHRRRERNIYEGPRLLIKRGIDQGVDDGGRIAARFETEPFCFRDSIHCAPASDIGVDKAKIVLGILWSSLVRYYLFLTSGTWGLWHDEVKKDVLYSIPVRFPKSAKLTKKIIDVVDELRSVPAITEERTLFEQQGVTKSERSKMIRELEEQLDDAVNELFDLKEDERDRVEELCNLELDLFYKGMKSEAVLSLDWPDDMESFGRRGDLNSNTGTDCELFGYLQVFMDLWEPQLIDQKGRMRWRVVRPREMSSMVAVIFEAEMADEPLPDPSNTDEQEWGELLATLDKSIRQPTRAKRVFIDGLVRIVTDSEIAILKRNERRLWTRSAARDDAEATMVMAMYEEGH